MCLDRYPWTVEITYDQGSEFIGREFKNTMINRELCIRTKPASHGNPQANSIVEIIQ